LGVRVAKSYAKQCKKTKLVRFYGNTEEQRRSTRKVYLSSYWAYKKHKVLTLGEKEPSQRLVIANRMGGKRTFG